MEEELEKIVPVEGAAEEDENTVAAARAAVEITRLKAALAGRENAVAALEASIEELRGRSQSLEASRREAVAAYTGLVINSSPGVLPEMVSGETVDEVNASLEKARAVVERVRSELAAGDAPAMVPAGAPPRSQSDITGLTPGEKIRYAVGLASS